MLPWWRSVNANYESSAHPHCLRKSMKFRGTDQNRRSRTNKFPKDKPLRAMVVWQKLNTGYAPGIQIFHSFLQKQVDKHKPWLPQLQHICPIIGYCKPSSANCWRPSGSTTRLSVRWGSMVAITRIRYLMSFVRPRSYHRHSSHMPEIHLAVLIKYNHGTEIIFLPLICRQGPIWVKICWFTGKTHFG